MLNLTHLGVRNLFQHRYLIQEIEVFAIIHELKTWRHYLCGNRLVVSMDQDLLGCKAQWADHVQDFNFSI